MAESPDDKLAEGKLDLVPLIDCIMLLLLFFILTTKFTSEEKTITSLLPTDKGQAAAPSKPVEPPQMINICIYPAGLYKGGQPSEYFKQLNDMRAGIAVIPKAWIKVGNADPIEMDGGILQKAKSGNQLLQQVEQVHVYLNDALAKFEKGGDRKTQDPVVIHCFSGLSWKYALVCYDAVRAYEAKVSGRKSTGNPSDFDEAREVDFAPPRIRDYSAKELGEELFEIIHMK
ncbi:MAG: biopolymer transporter ExbD [Planctomycetes bacterium]|nr:biopolymer transporter ExbD [Planctomycetota bacterium]